MTDTTTGNWADQDVSAAVERQVRDLEMDMLRRIQAQPKTSSFAATRRDENLLRFYEQQRDAS